LGRLLTLPANIRLGIKDPSRNHSSSLLTHVNYDLKKIYNTEPRKIVDAFGKVNIVAMGLVL
jgi:hypothetical protein